MAFHDVSKYGGPIRQLCSGAEELALALQESA